jgi:pimeloyl-ACP methyl ester carboxylesterase
MLNTAHLKTDLPHNIAVNSVQAGAGTPVILVHGLAASLHDWDDLLPALANAGYAGHALDLLGHGDSLKPPHLEDYNADTVFGHMKGWLDTLKLDQAAVLIGHSLGGYFALRFAQQYPERVRALVLVNPFFSQAQLPLALRLVFKQPLLNTTVIERTPYWLFRFLIDITSLQFGKGSGGMHTLPEKVRQQTALDYKRSAPGIYNIPRTLPDWPPDFSRVTHPTLVAWGAKDQTLDTASFSQLVEVLPNARGEALSLCGHVPHQCHASSFNQRILAFLETIETWG